MKIQLQSVVGPVWFRAINIVLLKFRCKKGDIKTLFNTRGTTYRTLKLKELALSDEDKQLWLAKENMLIKRPVIELDNKVIVGYNESQYLETIH